MIASSIWIWMIYDDFSCRNLVHPHIVGFYGIVSDGEAPLLVSTAIQHKNIRINGSAFNLQCLKKSFAPYHSFDLFSTGSGAYGGRLSNCRLQCRPRRRWQLRRLLAPTGGASSAIRGAAIPRARVPSRSAAGAGASGREARKPARHGRPGNSQARRLWGESLIDKYVTRPVSRTRRLLRFALYRGT